MPAGSAFGLVIVLGVEQDIGRSLFTSETPVLDCGAQASIVKVGQKAEKWFPVQVATALEESPGGFIHCVSGTT
jgi:hypothetical protein